MIKLEATNQWTKVQNIPIRIAEELSVDLRYFSPDANPYCERYTAGLWDGFVYLYDRLNSRFPTGMLTRVVEFLKGRHLEYELTTVYGDYPPQYERKFTPEFDLRPYQEEALARGLKIRRGVISIPTGGGKTEVMQALINALGFSRVVIIVPTRALLRQTVRRFRAVFPGETVIQCGGGKTAPLGVDKNYILVATPQAISKTAEIYIKNAGAVFVDEAHHQASDLFKRVTDLAKNSRCFYGFSATPFRYDGTDKELEAWLGRTIYEVPYEHLIENGWLVPPKFHKVHSLLDALNKVANKRALIFSETEAPLIAQKALFDHHNVKILTSKSPDIDEALKDFIAGRIKAIACTPIFDEGLDISDIEAVVFFSCCASPVRTIQRIGRGLRLGKKLDGTDKTHCDVYDLPDKAYRARIEAYERIPAFNKRLYS